jgi:myo-inositol catabolism protein IolS
VIIASKVGHFPGTAAHAYEPLHIRHQCEQSLLNLKRDFIDIYYLHHGDFGPNDEYLQGAAETLDALVKEGKVRVKGQSAYSVEHFEKTIPVVRPQVLQGRANALGDGFIRAGSRLQELMSEHGLSFVAFSPLAQGRLLDKYDPANPPAFEPGDTRKANPAFTVEEIAALKPKLEKLKRHFGCGVETLVSVALNYVLAHPNVACVIPGFLNERQAKCNLTAAQRTLSEDDLRFIREALA